MRIIRALISFGEVQCTYLRARSQQAHQVSVSQCAYSETIFYNSSTQAGSNRSIYCPENYTFKLRVDIVYASHNQYTFPMTGLIGILIRMHSNTRNSIKVLSPLVCVPVRSAPALCQVQNRMCGCCGGLDLQKNSQGTAQYEWRRQTWQGHHEFVQQTARSPGGIALRIQGDPRGPPAPRQTCLM